MTNTRALQKINQIFYCIQYLWLHFGCKCFGNIRKRLYNIKRSWILFHHEIAQNAGMIHKG